MNQAARVAPGVVLCTALALASVRLADVPWIKTNLRFSPLLIVILLGIAIGSLIAIPSWLADGVAYCQKPVLRLGVALLGLKLSLIQLGQMGGAAAALIATVTVVGFFAALPIGRWLGLGPKPTLLLATGGSICGASAIVAADTVIQGEGKDAAVSLAVITFWGTVGIFAYPALGHALGYASQAYGVFCGATLHEVAQVVAAAANHSDDAQVVATVAKLARVCLLAPTILGLGWWMRQQGESGGGKATLVPWFLWVFVLLAGVRTLGPTLGIEPQLKAIGDSWVPFVLSIGMAGVGLKTRLAEVVQAGWRPVALGLLQWLIMIGLAAAVISGFGIDKVKPTSTEPPPVARV